MSVPILRPAGEDHRALPISLIDAKEQLRVDHDEHDRLILRLVRQATDYVETHLDCTVIYRPFTLQSAGFTDQCIEINSKFVRSISSIKYFDSDNVTQTLDPLDYALLTGSNFSQLVSTSDSWPGTAVRGDAVTIELIIGIADRPSTVPGSILTALNLLIGEFYTQTGETTFGASSTIALGVHAHLNPYMLMKA